MSFTHIDPFTTPGNYSLVNTEITGGKGKLLLGLATGLTFSQGFAADTGFTYNSSYAEFVGSLLRQKDQRLSGSSFHANYNLGIDGNYGNGSLVATNVSGVVNAGKLELLGGVSDKHVDYVATSNADSLQVGCIRMRITPNYSGTPVTDQHFIRISQANANNNNALGFFHSSAIGNFAIRAFNNVGTSIISVNLATWSPTAGVEYEIEYNWDLTTGATRLFIDGVQLGATQVATGTRSGAVALMRIGQPQTVGTSYANFYVNNMVIFPTVQHTANYTPAAFEANYAFIGSKVDLPNFTYVGVGSIQAISNLTVTEVGSPRYIIEGKYWNGSAWVASSGAYAQANPLATVVANLGSLNVVGETVISVSIVFTDGSSLSSVDTLVMTYTGNGYTDGTITPAQGVNTDGIISFAATITVAGADEVRFIMKVNGTNKWWNGAAWVNSNGTFAESNTLAAVQANIATIVSVASVVVPVPFLHTTAGLTTPEIDDMTIVYDYNQVNIPSPFTTNVYGFVKDHAGNPVVGATVVFFRNVPTTSYQEVSDTILHNQGIEVTTDVDGEFSSPLIPADYKFIAYKGTDFGILNKADGSDIIVTVPAQYSVNITDQISA